MIKISIPFFFDGYHLPDGVHECTFEEIEKRFLFTDIRGEKWKQFQKMIKRMYELGIYPKEIIIGGSFVTGRREPEDVDFIALVPPEKALKSIKVATDEDGKEILLFANLRKQLVLKDLIGAHLLFADDKETLNGWIKLLQKVDHDETKRLDKTRDPFWIIRPSSYGLLKVKLNK